MDVPVQQIALETLLDKYTKDGEQSIDEIRWRVAHALAAAENHPEKYAQGFYDAQVAGFIPAGRINSAAGTGIAASLINCFVQPVGDSMSGVDQATGKVGITTALAEAAETMRRGGGVGYSFGDIRPMGAKVNGTRSIASGPLSYMRMFDSMCQTVESAGARRGAQMGVIRCDHPDIEAFIDAKARPYAQKELTQFNLSVAATDEFMEAVEADAPWQLVHRAEPSDALIAAGAFQRKDGLWVYRTVRAADLMARITASTYGFSDPGVLFVSVIKRENNLWYIERIEATNPCGEQPLPDYGCCCLGQLNLVSFVVSPFTGEAYFDMEALKRTTAPAVRMLDNVLDVTLWPLEQQAAEAAAKRRIGLGFTGLGDALIMLGLRYDSEAGRAQASAIIETMRDAAYMASVELAKEKGSFPLLDVERYLESGFMRRMPEAIREQIRIHGIRNSHLLSVAPTGTISLAFGNNVASGIEPPFAWYYERKVRQPDGTRKTYMVYDYAFHCARPVLDPDGTLTDEEIVARLPEHWVTAMEISPEDHIAMVAAVAPYVDSAISKTINVPEDYPYDDFAGIYTKAWKLGLKGVTTYRPNSEMESVLSVPATEATAKADFDDSDPDRRIRVEEVPKPALGSLKWRSRPQFPAGNSSWTYMVKHPLGSFAVMVGNTDNGDRKPFECWVNGAEVPRGLGAIAKSLSMDMRTKDGAFLQGVLGSLVKTIGDDGFNLEMPPDGRMLRVPSMVSGFAQIVKWRCEVLGAFELTPDAGSVVLLSPKEPKTGPGGTLSWTVDVLNPATGDDFVMGLKELVLPSGQRRPYSVWLSGVYPRVLDGLCKVLSYDMRVVDPAWVGAKLRQLLDFPEFRGDFFAKEPMSAKSRSWPSTVAYMAALIVHRYAMLGILDEEGFPMEQMGVMTYMDGADNVVAMDAYRGEPIRSIGAMEVQSGKLCPDCGNYSMIRRDGCDFCTFCGATGACG